VLISDAVALSKVLCFLAVALSSLEMLVTWRSYSDRGLLSWPVLSTSRIEYFSGWPSAWMRLVFSQRGYSLVIGARLLLAIVLLFNIVVPSFEPVGLDAALLLLMVLSLFRSAYGTEGSDQMLLVLMAGLLSYDLLTVCEVSSPVPLWFVASQSCLSYFISGYAKLISPLWRRGEAIRAIMSTEMYGNRTFANALDRWPLLCSLLSWAIIIWEVLFPLGILCGADVRHVFLAIGVVFHISIAFIMGLNVFAIAFIGCYPSIEFCLS
jgi:hypothetical protein